MTTPIACSLDRADYAERLRSISRLHAEGLRAHERAGRMLVLTYAPELRARIRQLVALESECCAFLTFTIEDRETDLILSIHAPDVTSEELEALFAPFLAGT